VGRPTGRVFNSINRLREIGVFQGAECGEKRFCPDDPVDRATFAVWLVRLLDEGSGGPAAAPRRLVELEIAEPCSDRPAALCPGEQLSRAKLATLITRALDLPESEEIGFWDVDEDSDHREDIDRLVGSGLDDGCSELRFVPLHFCPDQLVSRGEMAKVLSEVLDHIEADGIIKVTPGSEPDNSIGLSVGFDEDRYAITVTWHNPDNRLGDVSHYILQWRPRWIGFNYQRYRVVDFKENGDYTMEFLPAVTSSELDLALSGDNTGYENYSTAIGNRIYYSGSHGVYSLRVVVAYGNDTDRQSATGETKVPIEDYVLHDLIESRVVAVYGDDLPWLVDTWRILNGPHGGVRVGEDNHHSGWGQITLTRRHIERLELLESQPIHWGKYGAVIHEMGHAYTVAQGIARNEAPKAIGWLYLYLLVQEFPELLNSNWFNCAPVEYYADLAEMSHYEILERNHPDKAWPFSDYRSWLGYWQSCGANDLSKEPGNNVGRDIEDIVDSVFINQTMPQWFYDNYQRDDSSIDLDKLWSDILRTAKVAGKPVAEIVYGLQSEFGGYCSIDEVRQLLGGDIESLETPWRDAGGCPD